MQTATTPARHARATKQIIVSILIVLFLFIGSSASSQSQIEMVEDVVIMRSVDPFTDDVELTLVIGPLNDPIMSINRLPSRAMTVNCVNGVATGIYFFFDTYLNNGDYGKFEFRVDGGELVVIQAFQSDELVFLQNRPGVSGLSAITAILEGSTVAVRATAYDFDTDQAQYAPGNLVNVMGKEGCVL